MTNKANKLGEIVTVYLQYLERDKRGGSAELWGSYIHRDLDGEFYSLDFFVSHSFYSSLTVSHSSHAGPNYPHNVPQWFEVGLLLRFVPIPTFLVNVHKHIKWTRSTDRRLLPYVMQAQRALKTQNENLSVIITVNSMA